MECEPMKICPLHFPSEQVSPPTADTSMPLKVCTSRISSCSPGKHLPNAAFTQITQLLPPLFEIYLTAPISELILTTFPKEKAETAYKLTSEINLCLLQATMHCINNVLKLLLATCSDQHSFAQILFPNQFHDTFDSNLKTTKTIRFRFRLPTTISFQFQLKPKRKSIRFYPGIPQANAVSCSIKI